MSSIFFYFLIFTKINNIYVIFKYLKYLYYCTVLLSNIIADKEGLCANILHTISEENKL